jgi:hypothetical protein
MSRFGFIHPDACNGLLMKSERQLRHTYYKSSCLSLSLLLSTLPSNLAVCEESSTRPAEVFVADRLLGRLVSDPSFSYSFQKAFRGDTHKELPTLDVLAGSTADCVSSLSVSIAPASVARKWDGSVDAAALTAAALLIDLRFAQENLTRFRYASDGIAVVLFFKNPFSDSSAFFQTRFQYGGSNKWEQSRDRKHNVPGGGNPFFDLFEEVPQLQLPPEWKFKFAVVSTWFWITEAQRDVTVEHLKSIFARCRT